MRAKAGDGKPVPSALLKQNTILDGLPEATSSALVRQADVVDLKIRQKIYDAEQPIREVYFPLNSVLSVVSHMQDGSQIEVGTIGREGMSAFPLLMGAESTANDCYCQVPGAAIKISANAFRELSATDAKFRQLLDRYLQAYVNMLGQLAACNRLHTIHERCARWLLTTYDRVSHHDIPLTQEYLAMMLGTSRSGVTIAAATLQHAGFIRYTRGVIKVLDREGLAGVACECYEVARTQFDGLLRASKDGKVRREDDRTTEF